MRCKVQQAETGSMSEVGRRIGVSPPTIRKMVNLGVFPVVMLGTRRRIPWAAVEEYLQSAKPVEATTGD
ncbi:MAG: helix-turn-helix domain-containing protein [Planctomycetaceae bacterium]|nr:helix-turn-helix domain-containing protein [Planctomycetaceae bacterium]